MPTDMMRSERGQSGAVLVMSQLAALWRQQPRARKLVAALALVGLLVGLGWTSLVERAPAWATVVTAHRDAETSECVAALQREGIAVRSRGRDVEVPPATLAQARAVLAASGLPDSGIGLRTFDEGSFLASGFAEQVSYKRAQQDELARSIKTLAPIDGARVHLALGHRSLFKERDQRPSASVSLRLRPGVAISGAQVQGIRQLVVGAVDGMRVEDVAVIDQLGNPLGGDEGGFGAAGSGGLIGDGQRQLEREVGDKVRGLLERLVGAGNVEVAVSADVDLRRVEETAEVYERERSAITAETRTREAAGKVKAANAGAAPSDPGGGDGGMAKEGGDDGLVRASATYAPSHVVTETRFPGARLRRLQLAVVVDVRRGAAGEPVPPGPGELELWGALVRNAAGLDESRGDRLELQALPFAAAPSLAAEVAAAAGTTSGTPGMTVLGRLSAETLVAGAVAMATLGALSFLAMRRRYATRLAASERRAEEAEAQAAQSERRAAAMPLAGGSAGGAEQGERISERAGEVVRRDLDGAALVLSAWLGGDEAAAEVAPRGEGRGMKGALS